MTIGMMIRARREELRMTLEDVSKAVGVSKATVSRWESGDIHKLKRDNIQALAASPPSRDRDLHQLGVCF